MAWKPDMIAKIKAIIKERVEDGTYTLQLPARKPLAREFGVSEYLVRSAVDALIEEGLLEVSRSRVCVRKALEAQPRAEQQTPLSLAPISADDLRQAIGQPGVQFITVEEFAGFARISKMTIYRLIHTGVLGSRRIGRDFRIPIDSAVEYLKEAGSWG